MIGRRAGEVVSALERAEARALARDGVSQREIARRLDGSSLSCDPGGADTLI
jgi:hypothetical protein